MAYQNQAFAVTPPDQITQQQTWAITVELDADGTGNTYQAELRKAPDSTEPVEVTIDDSGVGTDPYPLKLSIDGSLTADLAPGMYVWDLWEITTAGQETPLAFGRININAAVTQIVETP